MTVDDLPGGLAPSELLIEPAQLPLGEVDGVESEELRRPGRERVVPRREHPGRAPLGIPELRGGAERLTVVVVAEARVELDPERAVQLLPLRLPAGIGRARHPSAVEVVAQRHSEVEGMILAEGADGRSGLDLRFLARSEIAERDRSNRLVMGGDREDLDRVPHCVGHGNLAEPLIMPVLFGERLQIPADRRGRARPSSAAEAFCRAACSECGKSRRAPRAPPPRPDRSGRAGTEPRVPPGAGRSMRACFRRRRCIGRGSPGAKPRSPCLPRRRGTRARRAAGRCPPRPTRTGHPPQR